MPRAGPWMPYADVMRPARFIRVLASLACMGVLVATGCQGGGSTKSSAATAPGAARGSLPASLVTSPIVSTREWRWNSVEGIEIDTRSWTIKSSLRSANFTGALPAFYEAALRNYRNGLVALPAPPRPSEIRYVPALCHAIRIKKGP